jgi:hypothetical protein
MAQGRRRDAVNWTLGYGALLNAVGIGGFVATGARHKTALIPAGFGTAALGLGLLARRKGAEGWTSKASALVGLLGFLGTARGLMKLPALVRGVELERPAAVLSQSAMAGLSAAYVALALRKLFG